MAACTEIRIDCENNAERWWDAARKNLDGCPKNCRALITDPDCDAIFVDESEGDEFVRWASRLA